MSVPASPQSFFGVLAPVGEVQGPVSSSTAFHKNNFAHQTQAQQGGMWSSEDALLLHHLGPWRKIRLLLGGGRNHTCQSGG